MAFPRAAPRVKGPYSERGGTRFRIRICDATGQRDLYFPLLKAARPSALRGARDFRLLPAPLPMATTRMTRRGNAFQGLHYAGCYESIIAM
jgi:hypothetical protein